MNLVTKSLAVLSAVFLLTACETAPNSGGANGNGRGGMNGQMGNGSMGELAPGVADRVFFDYDSASLNSEGQRTLEKQATWLKQNSGSKLTIEGHCDERGTREYNIALGERRANAVKKYLAGLGVSNSRMSTISYGKERPAVIGSDETSYGQNRRAVSVLSN